MKNDERWLSHNYYVSYMIMQSNMTMNAQVIKQKRFKLRGNISRNVHGKAIIGRYGGCFEEDIIRLMCDRAYHITGFGCTCEVCTTSRGEKGQCTVPQRLENCGKVRVRIIHGPILVIKKSYTYCKSLLTLEAKYYYACPQGDRLVRKDHRPSPTATHKEDNQ